MAARLSTVSGPSLMDAFYHRRHGCDSAARSVIRNCITLCQPVYKSTTKYAASCRERDGRREWCRRRCQWRSSFCRSDRKCKTMRGASALSLLDMFDLLAVESRVLCTIIVHRRSNISRKAVVWHQHTHTHAVVRPVTSSSFGRWRRPVTWRTSGYVGIVTMKNDAWLWGAVCMVTCRSNNGTN